jgi:hypothetical protein
MTATTITRHGSIRSSLVRCVEHMSDFALNRVTYIVTVVLAATTFWLAPRLPMVDLPQHVAQITLWQDLIMGRSPWADLFQINLFTPYLTTYTTALGLSFLMPATIAFKVVLTIAFLAFVLSCIQLRQDYNADRRFDWLFIISFFGVAYEWGLVTFLVATPICLQFIRLAGRQAVTTDWRYDLGVVALGLVLLVSHGLLFLLGGLIGGCLLLVAAPSFLIFARRALPYAVLGAACLAFVWAGRDALAAPLNGPIEWHGIVAKLRSFTINLQSSYSQTLVPLTLCMLAAVWLMRPKFNRAASVPFAVVFTVYILLPHIGYATAFLYQRFAMLLLPLLVLAFCDKSRPVPTLENRVSLAVLMLCCWGTIAITAKRVYTFGIESADFEVILGAAEPGRRAVSYIDNDKSFAADNPLAYLHYASWYQVEKHGLVEFNFAYFHPQVVRYKPSTMPNPAYGFFPREPFDWSLSETRTADYYFIRRNGDTLPRGFATAPACEVKLLRQAGAWSLFERGRCKT